MRHILILVMILGMLESPIQGTESASQSAELAAILHRAAMYCEKLKGAAYHYYCRERITEVFRPRQGKVEKKRLLYDYQIVGLEGKITEKRILLRENGHKMHVDNAPLKTTYFQSYYPIWLPVTLLAAEKQARYRYRLQGVEKIENTCTFVLGIEPRNDGDRDLLYGTVWLECADASVIRIMIDPQSLPRFPEYQKASLSIGGPLILKDTHAYYYKQHGIRFPTLTEFVEAYQVSMIAQAGIGLANMSMSVGLYERTHATVIYDRFHFFKVTSEVAAGIAAAKKSL